MGGSTLRVLMLSSFSLLVPFCRSPYQCSVRCPALSGLFIRLMVRPLAEKHLAPEVLFTLSTIRLCDHFFSAMPEPVGFESQFQEWKGSVTHLSFASLDFQNSPISSHYLLQCNTSFSLLGFKRGERERRAMDFQWGNHRNRQENSLWVTLRWISRPFTSRSSGDALPRKWNKGNSKLKISFGVVFK